MKNTYYRTATIVYMTAITVISIWPTSGGGGIESLGQLFNNLLHIPAYGLLALLLIKSAPKFKYVYIASFLFAVIFGIFNEYLQSFVPGRTASVSDALLNGIGSLSVVLLYSKRYKLSVKG